MIRFSVSVAEFSLRPDGCLLHESTQTIFACAACKTILGHLHPHGHHLSSPWQPPPPSRLNLPERTKWSWLRFSIIIHWEHFETLWRRRCERCLLPDTIGSNELRFSSSTRWKRAHNVHSVARGSPFFSTWLKLKYLKEQFKVFVINHGAGRSWVQLKNRSRLHHDRSWASWWPTPD